MSASESHPDRPERLYDVYVFDLDGTLYLGDELLPGARRLIEALRRHDRVVRFVSNNPTRDPEQYAAKLGRLGLPTPPEEIVTTTQTTTRWLRAHAPGANVFVIGEEPLRRAVSDAGFDLTEDPARVDVVVSSYDRGFHYAKLQIAFDAIRFHGRARLVATNPDPFCPMPGGRGEPDCAAVTAAIEACTGARCEATLGKPDPIMLEAALTGLDVRPQECLLVGDRLSTDIQMGLDAGADTALVLTGETTAEDLSQLPAERRPRFVLDRVDDVWPPRLCREFARREDTH